jgi:FdhE protein
MTSAWDQRISRAQELSRSIDSAAELLGLYVRLCTLQKAIFEEVTAALETDPAAMSRYFPEVRDLIQRHGPPQAKAFLRDHFTATQEIEDALVAHWDDPVSRDVSARFIALVLLQPFAESLAGRGQLPRDTASRRCPFCGAPPLAAVLREEGDGGKRYLLCSLCGIEWEFRRVLCPNCGEEDKDKLPVYTSGELAYIRIEACERCHTYLKGIDMTKNGHAVPVVDELASVFLNVWAEENGYTKAEPNLLGL